MREDLVWEEQQKEHQDRFCTGQVVSTSLVRHQNESEHTLSADGIGLRCFFQKQDHPQDYLKISCQFLRVMSVYKEK